MYLNISFPRNGRIAENENNKIANIEHEDSDRPVEKSWRFIRTLGWIEAANRRPQIGSFHTVHWLDTRSRNTRHDLPSTYPTVRKKSIETKVEISISNSGIEEEEESKSFLGIELKSF